LAIGLATALLLGQRAAADSPFTVDAWSTADGLPQSSVIAITQTHDGYLWLGTLNGLVRFDGNSFTPFNVNNTPGLPSDRIVFLFEDSHSNLWVGTENAGLCSIQNGVVRHFDTPGVGRITYGFEEPAGAVWFYDAAGNVFSWRNGKLEPHSADISGDFAQKLFERSKHVHVPGRNGAEWNLEFGRVVREGRHKTDYGPSPWAVSQVPSSFPVPDAPGTVGVLTIDRAVTATAEDGDGRLVVGTADSGVFWLESSGAWRHITADQNSFQNSVLAVCFDHEGNLWVGTDGGGIYRVRRSYFGVPAGLSEGVAKSVAQDSAGGLWVAFNAHGLTYSSSNTTSSFAIGKGSNAWSVLVDRQQRVWAGTRNTPDEGLFRFESGSFQPVPEAQPVGPSIYALFQSRNGTLWVGGQNGLAGFDGQNWKIFSPADGLPPGAIRAFAEDVHSNLWIGSESAGIFQLRGGKIFPTNAPIQDISCLLSDRDGVLWAGTSGHGLTRFAQGHWTSYSATNGLIGDDIGYLVEDDFTNLWIGSYEGLMRVDAKSLSELGAGTTRQISCRTFLTRECSVGAQPAATRTRDGWLLFPTIEGLVSVNPANLRPDTNPPPVVIESVLVDGVSQKNGLLGSAWPEPIVMQPENEQLEIHFTALTFSAPKGAQFGAQFRYQLEGRDNKPLNIGSERVARFGKLSPGNYVFHVTACNEDGYWNNTGASVALVVEPPFWRKPWFLTASVLLFLGALAGTIYLISTAKLRRQLRVAQQKEAIERERARIARDLHDQLGANLTQITLLGEMAETDKDVPAEIEQHAEQICATARETTRSLDEIVWAVNPSNDTLESLANYACKYAQDYFAMAGVSYRAELPPGLPPAPILPEVRHNVFLAFKEAVNNVVKHAHATEARVKLQWEPDRFILSVADNGRGLGDLSEKKLRNGLKNMRRRLADVHGEFEITPGAAGGTVVRLTVPLGNHK
jgi:signal transduction histidine kinase